jgi:hypothetical protein
MNAYSTYELRMFNVEASLSKEGGGANWYFTNDKHYFNYVLKLNYYVVLSKWPKLVFSNTIQMMLVIYEASINSLF